MRNLSSDMKAYKSKFCQFNFFLSTSWWLNALKRREKIIRENAFEQKREKPGWKFNPGLALIGLRTSGPRTLSTLVVAWRPFPWSGNFQMSYKKHVVIAGPFHTRMNYIGMVTGNKCRGSGYSEILVEAELVTTGCSVCRWGVIDRSFLLTSNPGFTSCIYRFSQGKKRSSRWYL